MDLDTVFLALRVVVALGAVFGALFFAHRWITRGRPGAPVRAKQIQIVARQGLGAKAGIAVVDAHGKRYLLGVTEHAVTVLDALGPAETPSLSLVATAPVRLPQRAFEEELQTVDLGTGEVPVLVTGTDAAHPETAAIRIAPQTRRAMREAEAKRLAAQQPAAGPLAGSVLSPETWRQTASALKKLR